MKAIDLNNDDKYDGVNCDDNTSFHRLPWDGDLSSSDLSLNAERLLDDDASSGDETTVKKETTDENEDDYEGEETEEDTDAHFQDAYAVTVS
jgi:hypothetical protein